MIEEPARKARRIKPPGDLIFFSDQKLFFGDNASVLVKEVMAAWI